MYCQCGCGQLTKLAKQSDTKLGWVKGQPIRFILGHKGKKRKKGYIVRNYSAVHVAKAESALGRKLPKGAEVHHVDGDSLNNENTNLVICQDRGYHILLHFRTRIVKAGGNPDTQQVCSACKTVKSLDQFVKRSVSKTNGLGYHCLPCRQIINKAYRRPA